ncbi:MAG: AraC family transcriptional regulator [Campylobacteraceae bacterium]|nr:AraC family transcriptional regulator [Campylobacteraceae bacterium]
MQKTQTLNIHSKIANDTLYYIYKYIDTDININDLAKEFKISKFHLHKVFKEQMQANIYETIKSIRLQKASSLLLSNQHSTITKISSMCGYSSQTSFIRAFKMRFSQTPNEWRKGGYKIYANEIINNYGVNLLKKPDFSKCEAIIIKSKIKKVYYLKNKGYSIKEASRIWQHMQAWIYTNDIKEYEELGIFHDNPVITPHKDCFYMAGVVLKNKTKLKHNNMPSFEMEEAMYASFEIQGVQGDVVRFVQWAYQEWLPSSGFSTTTNPSFAIFRKNQFLQKDGKFEATFYLPIQYI